MTDAALFRAAVRVSGVVAPGTLEPSVRGFVRGLPLWSMRQAERVAAGQAKLTDAAAVLCGLLVEGLVSYAELQILYQEIRHDN